MATGPDPTAPVLGVDVGGTFTDVVHWDGTTLTTAKVPSTPDQSEGVVAGSAAAGGIGSVRLLHGTTVATNALLERKGAGVALITTEGFEDVIEIGRQDRPSLYDSLVDRPEPLVAADRRIGLGTGAADAAAVAAVLDGVQAVAVSLLYAYEDPAAERAIEALIRRVRPDLAVSLSCEVVPEFREFERTSTTVLNAYLAPTTGAYLDMLAARSTAAGLTGDIAVMRSSGGLMPVTEAARLPAAILLSGPAGGVVAASALGVALGKHRLVSFDMGGTSTDVCRIEGGRPEVSYERAIDGYPCRLPSVAVHTVGAGGGSIGWLDEGGSLRVGPQSAGAVPGPACYDRGGSEPTVTDANIVLGRIDAAANLAGRLPVRADLALSALAAMGERGGLGAVETALGMTAVVEEIMAGAIRRVSIEQGADPREATLVAFGGSGGLHAAALARRLEMAGLVVPADAGVFSALGLLLSAPRVDVARTIMTGDDRTDVLDVAVGRIVDEAIQQFVGAVGVAPTGVESLVDVRYRGQSHELTVPYAPGDGWLALADRFHRLHHDRNGFSRPDDPLEAVTVRAEAVGAAGLRWDEIPAIRPTGDPARGSRRVVARSGPTEAAVWWRPSLRPGTVVVGPAVIEETNATTFLDAGERATVHPTGALEVTW